MEEEHVVTIFLIPVPCLISADLNLLSDMCNLQSETPVQPDWLHIIWAKVVKIAGIWQAFDASLSSF